MSKKGISPLIATVIIVGFTIVLAVVVVSWVQKLANDVTSQVSCETEANSLCRNLPPIPVSIKNNSNAIQLTPVNTYSRNLTFLFVLRNPSNEVIDSKSKEVANNTSPVYNDFAAGTYASGNSIEYTIFLPYILENEKCEVRCKEQKITIK